MLGFDPLTLGSLVILAASSKNLCQMPAPTKINVKPATEEVKYDYSQTMDELQAYAMDTVDPHGFHGISTTQGFMKGAISMEPAVKLNYKHFPKYGAVCIWYEQIDISFKIDPTIVIAKEVYQDKCMHNAVREHELKHVKVDRQIVNKYAKIMANKVYAALKDRGFISRPIQQEYAKDMAERMQQTVFQIVQHEYKKMDLERAELQQAVDSKEEYERVSAMCPEYQEKRAALLRKKR